MQQGPSHSAMARIGMVNFINTAPLYEVWKQRVNRPEWRVIEAPPATLNRMLRQGLLDLGFVSSQEYAANPAGYRILADLSISATGPVGSVLLFSSLPPRRLDNRLVLLSEQSRTSQALVRIILEEFYQVRPRYLVGSPVEVDRMEEAPEAVLAIGDNALRLAAGSRYPEVLDLSEVWQRHTGLPFVFAVWAVREEFCRTAPDTVADIHRELRRCVAEGRRDLGAICELAAPKIPMSPEDCLDYLSKMEYDLGPRKQAALGRFFEYLVKRGEAGPAALPLKIFQGIKTQASR